MKRILLAGIGLGLLFLFGCGQPKVPPGIEVTAGGSTIPWTVGIDRWNGAIVDRLDGLEVLIEQGHAFPYIALGETIHIRLTSGQAPDKATLRDGLLRQDGSPTYNEQSTGNVPITFQGREASFVLEANPGAWLSSQSADYAPGATVRGFRLTCSWGDNVCEYAFILRTDAGGPAA